MEKNRSTDLWIESHQQLGKHPKMLRAARMLGINRVQMVGHLQYLWWWALDFATAGDIADYDAADIADAALWDGDPEQFYSALVACGWIDKQSDQDVILHDWHDYAGKLLEGREKQAEKMRRWREKQHGDGYVPPIETAPINKEEARNGHVTVTLPSRDGLTVTVTETVNDLSAAEPQEQTAVRPQPKSKSPLTGQRVITAFGEFWEIYPKRDGARVGRKNAEIEFAKLDPAEWPEVLEGVERYAKLCDPDRPNPRPPKDAERFLRDRVWRDMLDAEDPPPPRPALSVVNGRAPSPDSEETNRNLDALKPSWLHNGGPPLPPAS